MNEDVKPETNEQPITRPRKRRIYRKRTVFRGYPRPAIAVRGLWESATVEEKRRAHQQCMAILEYWLGKATKQEVAERLEVAQLRVWQMSQQALSGMLAGLLRQPKRRANVVLPPARPEEDPRLLGRRILELEKKLACTEDLVRVLRDLPWSAAAAQTEKEDGDGRRKKTRRTARATRRPKNGARGSTRSEAGNRQKPAGKSAARHAGADGTGAEAQRPYAAQLGGDGEAL